MPLFLHGVVGVASRDAECVSEDCRGLAKRDAVPAKILRCLLRVPLEIHSIKCIYFLIDPPRRKRRVRKARASVPDLCTAGEVLSPMKAIVVTGCSTGIGRSVAERFVKRGYRVFGSVRRTEDGDKLRKELGDFFTPLLFDVRDDAAVGRAAEEVRSVVKDGGLSGLVNNAGVAAPGPLMYLTAEEFRLPFEVNVMGTLNVTRAFLPLLGAREDCPHPPGRIVNVSSISGWYTFPFNTPYCVSKHGLEALSDGLRRELGVYGIDVVVIVPGAIRTPIWNKVEELDVSRFKGSVYYASIESAKKLRVEAGKKSVPVDRVSDAIQKALESPRPKTRYRITGSPLREWFVPRSLPDRWLDRLLWRMIRLPPLV